MRKIRSFSLILSQIFADFRFSWELQHFGKNADFRRKPQETADFCRNPFVPFSLSLLVPPYVGSNTSKLPSKPLASVVWTELIDCTLCTWLQQFGRSGWHLRAPSHGDDLRLKDVIRLRGQTSSQPRDWKSSWRDFSEVRGGFGRKFPEGGPDFFQGRPNHNHNHNLPKKFCI